MVVDEDVASKKTSSIELLLLSDVCEWNNNQLCRGQRI